MSWRSLLSLIALAALTACGGGDGSSGTTAGGDDDDDDDTVHVPDTTDTELDFPIEPVVEWTLDTFEEESIVYAIPENPTGLMFFFHGTGGDIGNLTQTEYIVVINAMYSAGIGFVATNSTDRSPPIKWDLSTANPEQNEDFPRLYRLWEHMVDTTDVSANTPLFAIGFSNGGGYATLFGEAALTSGMPFRAASSHNSGLWGFGATVPFPVIFVMSENDGEVNTAQAQADVDRMLEAGQEAVLYEHTEFTLDPLYFTRISSFYDDETSRATFDEVVAFGMVAEDGTRVVPIDDADKALNRFPDSSEAPSPLKVTAQLRVVWAMHRFAGTFYNEERRFFVDAL